MFCINLGENLIDESTKCNLDHNSLSNLNRKLTMFDPKRPKDLKKIKNIIQEEIDILNEELRVLQHNFTSKKDIFDEKFSKKNVDNILENNATGMDTLGNEFLSLVKTIKCLIKSNLKENETKAESKNETCNWLFFFYRLTNFKCNNIRSCTESPIKKRNDNKCKRNLHYVNTLENLKLNIVKPRKKKNLEQVSATECEKDTMTKRGYKYLNLLQCYKQQINGFTQFGKGVLIDKKKKSEIADFSNDWKLFAIVIDRMIFLIFSLIIPICLLLMYFKFYLKEPVELD